MLSSVPLWRRLYGPFILNWTSHPELEMRNETLPGTDAAISLSIATVRLRKYRRGKTRPERVESSTLCVLVRPGGMWTSHDKEPKLRKISSRYKRS